MERDDRRHWTDPLLEARVAAGCRRADIEAKDVLAALSGVSKAGRCTGAARPDIHKQVEPATGPAPWRADPS